MALSLPGLRLSLLRSQLPAITGIGVFSNQTSLIFQRHVCRVSCAPPAVSLPEIAELLPSNNRSHHAFYEYSIHQPEQFWGALAKSRLSWMQPFNKVLTSDMEEANFRWFEGGSLNAAVNCVHRHAAKTPDKVALIWEKDEPGTHQKVTYRELEALVNQFANLLLAHDVSVGDRVAIYMPVSPMAVAAMLGCAMIGAVHTVVFAGFSADALASRINDAKAEIVITADRAFRGGKSIELKKTVDQAVTQCPGVRHVFVWSRSGQPLSALGKLDLSLDKQLSFQSTSATPVVMDSEDPLFMLYTSGSTGQPKGLVHTHAGYLLYSMLTHQLVFDHQEGDVFGCVADVGWITGHTYAVYGPLANGATSVLFESTPTYPDPGRYWEMVERLKITQFYGAPTAIRLLIRYGDEWPKKYDKSSLRVLGSVGEPINHDAWDWYGRVVGEDRCMVVDTWWQTETGGICIAPCPAETGAEIKPACAMRPFYGIKPVMLDESITGRMDDVINVTGHRLGTAEIEDVIDAHSSVSESAVVGFPHDLKGEGIFAFVNLKEGVKEPSSEIVEDLKAMVKKSIAGYAVPDYILISDGLPKTRSGKIMRRILRHLASGKFDNLGDVSTLAEPGVVTSLVEQCKAAKSGARPK